MKKQADSIQEINWRGKRLIIKSEKLRVAILSAQEVAFELEKEEAFEAKMSLFDKLFVAYGDALTVVRDEIQAAVNFRLDSFPDWKTKVDENGISRREFTISAKISFVSQTVANGRKEFNVSRFVGTSIESSARASQSD